MWDGDLVNRMLNQRHPVGQQYDTHSDADQDRKQQGARDYSCERSISMLLSRIKTGDPQNRSGEKHNAENQRDVVSGGGRQAEGDPFDQ